MIWIMKSDFGAYRFHPRKGEIAIESKMSSSARLNRLMGFRAFNANPYCLSRAKTRHQHKRQTNSRPTRKDFLEDL